MWERGALICSRRQCKLEQLLWKSVWRILKQLERNLWCDPAILLLGICPKLNILLIDTCSVLLIAAVFTMREVKPTTCLSTDKWLKTRCLYTIGYYSAVKKNKVMNFADKWMELGKNQIEWDNLDRERQMPHVLYPLWFLAPSNWRNNF